ncbi:ribbon-helix-helix protein, CopG family [Chamaesiphon sp.]|uniref:ribbon-helix-helix protein, CopG family n=1 Tax=Chamaesiphon sp. TaxID=2814140 RepID=UPI003593767C
MPKARRYPVESANVVNVGTEKGTFWQEVLTPKVRKVRLGLDISEDLDNQLTEKAKELKQSKSELVRKLIKWGLERG